MKILVIDDEKSQRDILNDILSDAGFQVQTAESAEQGIKILENDSFALVLTDYKMPGKTGMDVLFHVQENHPHTQVIIMTAFGTIPDAVQAIKEGAYDYLTKPFEKEDLLRLTRRATEKAALVIENERLKNEISERHHYQQLIGGSAPMQKVYSLIERIKDIDATVLISGESGTGKELVARAIHFGGHRAKKPFVAVNCGAIPETLIESELFGHEKGAFTGAVKTYVGKFEQANGGTILLDEIGTMRLDLQIRLLRVLQEKKVQRIGSQQVQDLDLRIIASSNDNLQEKITLGTFREDLFHRLNVFHIHLPALRERQEDLFILARHFIQKYSARYNNPLLKLSPNARRELELYSFPGNVRELENCIEKAVILSEGEEISEDDLMLPKTEKKVELQNETLPGLEKEMIIHALESTRGSIKETALDLGISYKTLQYRLNKHNIDKNKFK